MYDSSYPRVWSAPSFLPCPSLSCGVCLNLCPLNQWCHPTIKHNSFNKNVLKLKKSSKIHFIRLQGKKVRHQSSALVTNSIIFLHWFSLLPCSPPWTFTHALVDQFQNKLYICLRFWSQGSQIKTKLYTMWIALPAFSHLIKIIHPVQYILLSLWFY